VGESEYPEDIFNVVVLAVLIIMHAGICGLVGVL
jgi:hypothetical protein